ncbi:lysylphosphatidylglycerol synthase domain-containing protein [Micromonospora sp. B11E3]|uniref:lysylphosphatidylglycerol synthase transmembrane domain-containing protein n=1 Tax=Micromonospora sp. B11E3 TaxID=3153562 RepID=UPI00325CEF2B
MRRDDGSVDIDPADRGGRTAMGRRGRLRHAVLVGVLLVATGVGVVVTFRSGARESVAVLARASSVPYLLAAVGTSVLGLWLAMAAWRRILADVAHRPGLVDSARIYFVSLLGKFIPGPIWGLLVQIEMGRTLGIRGGSMTIGFFLNLGVTLLCGATVGMVVAPTVLGGQALWLTVPLAVTVACFAWPALVNQAVTRVLRVLRRRRPAPDAPAVAEAGPRAVRVAIALSLASWTVYGLHVWIIVTLLGAPPLRSLPVAVGAFGLAAVAGGFAVLLPDGWGAREAVLVLALASVLPWPVAGVAAVTSRLVVLVSEVGLAGIAMLVGRVLRARQATDATGTSPAAPDRAAHVAPAPDPPRPARPDAAHPIRR